MDQGPFQSSPYSRMGDLLAKFMLNSFCFDDSGTAIEPVWRFRREYIAWPLWDRQYMDH